eukprot:14003-Heterococcus_DN1.PRE.1
MRIALIATRQLATGRPRKQQQSLSVSTASNDNKHAVALEQYCAASTRTLVLLLLQAEYTRRAVRP